MPMDPQLAAMYGTNQVDADDAEKLAAAEAAEELAEEKQLDVSALTDEEAEAMATRILAPETEETEEQAAEDDEEKGVKEPEAEGQAKMSSAQGEEPTPEMQEKIAEADFLGRVMAHSYTQELRKIAADEQAKTKKASAKPAPKAKTAAPAEQAEEQVSNFDRLAQARAVEILKENGIELQPQGEEQAEKSAAAEGEEEQVEDPKMAAFAAKVDARAIELLKANGYTFEGEEK